MSKFDGKPFTDVLGELEDGEFLRELTEKLYMVVCAVRETRKAGAVKVAIKVTPTGKGSVMLDATSAESIPEHDRPSTTFFVDANGTRLRNDPSQPRLPLREVEAPQNDPIHVRG